MPRALIYVLIFIVWAVFAIGVKIYQDRDDQTAGEHPESDADLPAWPEEPPLECAA
jgi:hypothetical protein